VGGMNIEEVTTAGRVEERNRASGTKILHSSREAMSVNR
jgi:hypothetical protein